MPRTPTVFKLSHGLAKGRTETTYLYLYTHFMFSNRMMTYLQVQVGEKDAEQSFSQLLLQLEEQKLDLVFYYPTEHASLVIKLMAITLH